MASVLDRSSVPLPTAASAWPPRQAATPILSSGEANLIHNGPWMCCVGGCAFLYEIYYHYRHLNWLAAVPMIAFGAVLAIACFRYTYLLSHVRSVSPRAGIITTSLFLAAAVHGAFSFYLTQDTRALGGLGMLLVAASTLLLSVKAYLALAGATLLLVMPAIPGIVTENRSEFYGLMAAAAITGFILVNAQRKRSAALDREIEAHNTSEARFRSIFENSIVGIFQCAGDGTLKLANRTLVRMLGYNSVEALLVASAANGTHTAAADAAHAFRHVVAGGNLEGGEFKFTHLDGSPVQLVLHARKVTSPSGNLIGYEGLALDITAQAEAQESLRQHEEQLVHASRLASLGEMLAAISHEVNQPLHAIANFAGASAKLLTDLHDPAADKLRQWNIRIAEEATRGGQIIRRLRGFAHKAEPKRSSVDLRKAIRESLALMDPVLKRNRVQVRVDCPAELPLVLADEILVEQVLTNLLLNACDAMSGISGGSRTLAIQVSTDAGLAQTVVTDNGRGLADADLRDIFTPFVSGKPEGLGLGLAICRTIVEGHGGQIWAAAADHTTSFHFTLPLASP